MTMTYEQVVAVKDKAIAKRDELSARSALKRIFGTPRPRDIIDTLLSDVTTLADDSVERIVDQEKKDALALAELNEIQKTLKATSEVVKKLKDDLKTKAAEVKALKAALDSKTEALDEIDKMTPLTVAERRDMKATKTENYRLKQKVARLEKPESERRK